MAKPHYRARVKAATVLLKKLGGRGVLVPGGFILTAAHCIKWKGTGGVLGDYSLEPILTSDGRKFLASVCAVEPVADIAALQAPDDEVLFDDYEAFEEFVDDVEPVPPSPLVPPLTVLGANPANRLTLRFSLTSKNG
jgi:hypothetical protein